MMPRAPDSSIVSDPIVTLPSIPMGTSAAILTEVVARMKAEGCDAVIHLAAVDAMAAASEDLIFGFAFDRAGLSAGGAGGEKGSDQKRCREH